MLTATLVKPSRLNAQGRTWERGVAVPVDLTTARLLSKNPRFQVDGLFEALDAIASGKTLEELGISETPAEQEQEDAAETEDQKAPADLTARIREAVDALDVDDDESFLENGQPNPVAVSVLLGEDVTAEQVAAAITVKPKGELVKEEGAAAPKRNLRVKGGSRPKQKAKAPAKEEAEEKAVEV